ncbi:hypothetical protein EKO27_g4681 [Xylaria grammica]|uniref:Uncharacterized protein n=1 Tax=Xylaria grammica TaxID=363999 RepID=A0A439D7P5_9PEZI|nr:hypothetical protein EKO27_g4681 [Xylaria grammica]
MSGPDPEPEPGLQPVPPSLRQKAWRSPSPNRLRALTTTPIYTNVRKKTSIGVLIDSYRLRVEDEHNFEGKKAVDSIHGGAESGLAGFREFLRLAGGRAGLLPPWWNAEKQEACEKLGMDSSEWQDLRRAVEKSDVIAHYGDSRFPMQLRMLAEMVIGRGLGGSDGTQMRKTMVMMEGGGMGGGPMNATTMDLLTGNTSAV